MGRDKELTRMPIRMDQHRAIEVLTALGQPTRLDVFRRLVNVHPDAILSGELARGCRVPQSDPHWQEPTGRAAHQAA